MHALLRTKCLPFLHAAWASGCRVLVHCRCVGSFFCARARWPWGRALRSQCTAEHDAPPHEPAQHVTPTTNTHTRAGRGKAAASPCAPRCS
jgi:hypothetical protein